jgi:LuxR family transcriptional regulator, maltose regulon positive regulatory protein
MLLTKLHIPPAGNNIVHRSVLHEKLSIGLSRKLILVSAPAGFGKTTVVSDWIDQNKIPVAWFSLDDGDNDPVDFLSYIISGIQSIQPAFGHGALKLLNSPNAPSVESIASLLINEILKINQNFLLVLDDFHLIKSNEVLKLVTYLLEHIPGNIHIAILTRSDPAISVSRLRSQHQLVELRSSDLSFSANDISILFNKKLKIGLSIEDVHSLESKTEGWAAGLQLTALSMQGREDISKFIKDFKGDNSYIMDYLMEEVLKIQTDDIKEFLVQTSMLEQLSASLCNAVLNRNDSQSVLEKLDKNNMFLIHLDEERNWYRYHHLFAYLLKQRLQLREKALINELHNKACDWFEQHNMFDFAIGHSLSIQNHRKCIQLIGGVVEKMWENGQHTAILKYGDILPDELIKTNTEFCLYYSWILISAGQIQKAEPFLECARLKTKNSIQESDSSSVKIQYYKKLLGKISVAFAYMNSHQEHSEKIWDSCKTAFESLSDEDPLWYSWAWFSYGIAHFSNGDIIRSSDAFQKAFEYSKKTGNVFLISTIISRLADTEQQFGHYKSAYLKCSELLELMRDKGYEEITKTDWRYASLYLNMAYTHYMWAEIDKAYENLKIAHYLCKKGSDIMLEAMVMLFYSFVLYEIGDIPGSEKKINEAEDITKQNDVSPYFIYGIVAWKLSRLVKLKQLDLANKLIMTYDLAFGNEISHVNESAYLVYVRLLLAEGKLPEAESILSKLYAIIYEGKRTERMIDLKISYAIFYKTQSNHKKAITSLTEAIELAAEENLIGFFLFCIDEVGDLLKEIFKTQIVENTNISSKFIENFKIAIERREKLRKARTDEGLSPRELDTLKLIAKDLSNQEIADKLFISLNTVKTHLKNIYIKLDVDNRTKAVGKAKELGIV